MSAAVCGEEGETRRGVNSCPCNFCGYALYHYMAHLVLIAGHECARRGPGDDGGHVDVHVRVGGRSGAVVGALEVAAG